MKIKLFLAAAGLCSLLLGAEPYRHPALNPVTFEKSPEHAPFELIRDGKAVCAIVRDMKAEKKMWYDRSSIRQAVEALQDAFQRITGSELPVLDASSPEVKKYPAVIAVGKSAFTEKYGIDPLKECEPGSGFLVRTVPGGIILAGYDGSLVPGHYSKLDWSRMRHNGTAHAAYDFCERFLGMRYYFPGIGVYSPKIQNLTVSPVAYRDKPVFLERFNYAYIFLKRRWPWKGVKDDTHRFAPAWRMAIDTPWVNGHTPNPIAMDKAFPNRREDIFFRSRGGSLYYTPHSEVGNFFDVTNPAFAKLLVDAFVKFYETNGKWNLPWKGTIHPSSEYAPFTQTDTFLNDLTNERSKKFIYPELANVRAGMHSDIYANFYLILAKELKKRLPDKKLSVSFYHSYTLPPAGKYDFPDNVRGVICRGNPIYVRSEVYREDLRDIFAGWSKVIKYKVGTYFYGDLTNAFTQAIQGYYTGEFLKSLEPWIWHDECFLDAGHNWRFYYSYYLVLRAMWNPDFNAKAALDEHWGLLYGPVAGAKLKEFFDILVDRWEKYALPKLKKGDTRVEADVIYAAYDGRTINRLEKLLQEAEKAVAPGSIEQMRLKFFMAPWTREFKVARNFHDNTIPEYKVRRLGRKDVIRIDGKGDEAVWEKAFKFTFREAKGSGAALPSRPEARLLWDEKGLYLFCRAEGKPAVTPGSIFDKSNHFEFFFSPGVNKNDYFQMVVSSAGEKTGNRRTLKPIPMNRVGWNPKEVQCAAVADEAGWSMELFIPFSAMECAVPKSYSAAFGNIIYNDVVSGRAHSGAWSLTMYNYHDVKYFGKLKFLGKGD